MGCLLISAYRAADKKFKSPHGKLCGAPKRPVDNNSASGIMRAKSSFILVISDYVYLVPSRYCAALRPAAADYRHRRAQHIGAALAYS